MRRRSRGRSISPARGPLPLSCTHAGVAESGGWTPAADERRSSRGAGCGGGGELTPTTMRAVVLRAAGGPEQLVYEQVVTPAPGPGEALVRVHGAALTRDELAWPVD